MPTFSYYDYEQKSRETKLLTELGHFPHGLRQRPGQVRIGEDQSFQVRETPNIVMQGKGNVVVPNGQILCSKAREIGG